MNFKEKIIKSVSALIASIMIINFIPCNIFQSFAEEIGDSYNDSLYVTVDFQEIGIETDLKIKVECSDGYTNIYDYDDLIDNKLYISNPDCSITFSNGLNTEDISDDIIICTVNDLNKYSNLKSRYKIKWMYCPFDLTVEPDTSNINTTIRLVTYINGDMSVDGYLKSNDLLILKQQLLFDYNIIQTGAYTGNSEDSGSFSIVGYDSDTCNSISINGDLYADNSMTIYSYGGNLNGNLICNGITDVLIYNYRYTVSSSRDFSNKDLLLNDDDINQLYFANIESQGSISYPENTSNINISEDVVSTGTIDLVATNSINLNASIKAEDDININGEVHNANNAIIYSKKDITIQNDSTFSFTGMIYAPNGKVTIKAKNVNITGTIIAKDIDIQAEVVNFNINNYIINNNTSKILSALQLFLGDMNNSGVLDEEDFKILQCILLGEEYVNWEDKDNNSIPDIFENQEEWKNYIDSDDDGLPDFLEIYLGTDKMLSDTDNDGLSDYIEVMILDTNPCLEDTDENGILDGDEDYDGDGLTNLEELEIGTDMTNIDTDEDGLDDYYEIKISKTNPLSKDTDGNGINDGDELFNQEVEIEVNDEESAVSGVNVELPTQRKNYNVTSIESVMGIDIMSSNVVGLVGEPYNFTTEGDFSEATVTFKINPENLGNTNFEDLAVLWYDEENQSYELLDTQLNEDTYEVSAITTHFSTGLVVDSVAWENAWTDNIYNDQINWDYCDTALVIDCSGSTNSVRGNEIDAAKKFVEGKMSDEKISIIAEESTARDMIILYNDTNNTNFNSLTDNEDNLINVLTMMKTTTLGGGNDFNSSLSMAYNNLSNSSSNNKIIIFLSDGGYILEPIKSIVNTIKQENIKIYTIGFQCNDSGREILSYMSSETGGKFFEMNDISDLDSIYNTINIEKNMSFSNSDYILKDSDNDGILDFFEINGLRLANGQFINLNAEYTNPQLNPDCDGDGVKDGTEITQFMKLTYLNMINNEEDELLNRKLFYFVLNSYPNNPDSDDDYYMDNVDTQKLHFDVMKVYDDNLNDDEIITLDSEQVFDGYYIDGMTDGILKEIPIDESDENINYKRTYEFNRNSNEDCKFELIPQKNSDYIVAISNVDNIQNISIRCYHVENHWYKNFNQPYEIDIEPQSSVEGENAIVQKNNTAYFNFVLKKGITYTFCINNTDDNISDYNIQISQNNWVYAPNGCYKIYSELFPLKTYSEYYLPDKLVYNIIKGYRIEKEGENFLKDINTEEYLLQKSNEQLYNATDKDSDYLQKSLSEGENTVISLGDIGNSASLIGVALVPLTQETIVGSTIVDLFNPIGIIVTLGGGCIALKSIKDDLYKNELRESMTNGKYNIILGTSTSDKLGIENGYPTVYSNIESYSKPWDAVHYINDNVNNKWKSYYYVNKYENLSSRIRADITIFDQLYLDINENTIKQLDWYSESEK